MGGFFGKEADGVRNGVLVGGRDGVAEEEDDDDEEDEEEDDADDEEEALGERARRGALRPTPSDRLRAEEEEEDSEDATPLVWPFGVTTG